MNKAEHKKFLRVGSGGTKCACCFPPPRSKARRAEFRAARRRFKEDFRKQLIKGEYE